MAQWSCDTNEILVWGVVQKFIKFIFNKYIFAHVSLPVEKEILIVNVQFGKIWMKWNESNISVLLASMLEVAW